MNLFGILNVASFVELVKTGTTTFDPVTGALNAADQVTARRIGVVGQPLESDPEKLRRVLFESLMVTAAYQAARALGTVPHAHGSSTSTWSNGDVRSATNSRTTTAR